MGTMVIEHEHIAGSVLLGFATTYSVQDSQQRLFSRPDHDASCTVLQKEAAGEHPGQVETSSKAERPGRHAPHTTPFLQPSKSRKARPCPPHHSTTHGPSKPRGNPATAAKHADCQGCSYPKQRAVSSDPEVYRVDKKGVSGGAHWRTVPLGSAPRVQEPLASASPAMRNSMSPTTRPPA